MLAFLTSSLWFEPPMSVNIRPLLYGSCTTLGILKSDRFLPWNNCLNFCLHRKDQTEKNVLIPKNTCRRNLAMPRSWNSTLFIIGATSSHLERPKLSHDRINKRTFLRNFVKCELKKIAKCEIIWQRRCCKVNQVARGCKWSRCTPTLLIYTPWVMNVA